MTVTGLTAGAALRCGFNLSVLRGVNVTGPDVSLLSDELPGSSERYMWWLVRGSSGATSWGTVTLRCVSQRARRGEDRP